MSDTKTFRILLPIHVEHASQKFSVEAQSAQEAIQFLKEYMDDDEHPAVTPKGDVIHSGYGHDLSDVGIHLSQEGESFDEDNQDHYDIVDTTKAERFVK